MRRLVFTLMLFIGVAIACDLLFDILLTVCIPYISLVDSLRKLAWPKLVGVSNDGHDHIPSPSSSG